MHFAPHDNAPRALHIHCEQSPFALSRVYALLALLNLVPDQSTTITDGPDSLWINMDFNAISHREFDLLRRKVAQLTETLEVSETQGFGKQKRVAC